jgi:L-ribulose-5-phosphate 3-epimerase
MSQIKLGVMVPLSKDTDVYEEFKKIKAMGFETCQLVCWDMDLLNDENADKVNKAVKELNVEITAFWCGWRGPKIWNFYEGPVTLGLIPETYRYIRMEDLIKGSDFTRKINVEDLVTHAGFIPENPGDRDYKEVVEAVKYVAQHCRNNGQYFLFETGQETPVTLRRLIEDIGTGNLGINLDPANLILYGKANPVDALEVFGEYVRGVHAKDGDYPTNGRELGVERAIGQGKVDFAALVAKLKTLNYQGALTIEREISGEQQIKDIKNGKEYLENLINTI